VRSRDFKSLASTNFATRAKKNHCNTTFKFTIQMEARAGIEPASKALQASA